MNLAWTVLCLLLQDPPAGTADQRLQYRLAHAYGHSEPVDPALLASGRSSPSFGTRYVALIVRLQVALARGDAGEAGYREIVGMSAEGGPRGAADHLRALAASYKAAAYCRECKDGKVSCVRCGGKKRVDVKCYACDGKGRVGAPGAVDKTQVLQKCRNCDGKAVFRDARCPDCSGTGATDCPSCLGRPWHDRNCSVKECRAGRVPCAECHGRGKVEVKCSTCGGRGRCPAPGALDPSAVTQRCNDCDGRGVLKEKSACPTCEGSAVGIGFARCGACGSENRKAPAVALSDVFAADSCADCGAKGFPEEGKAVACAKCLGLGVRIKPASNPARTLE